MSKITHIRLYERDSKMLRNKFDGDNSEVFASPWTKRKAMREALIRKVEQAKRAWLHFQPHTPLDIVEEHTDSRGKVHRKVIG